MTRIGHLPVPPDSPAVRTLFEEDRQELGFVMNVSRLWAYRPELVDQLFGLMREVLSGQDLSREQAGVVVAACAATVGDSYCSLAWGTKLAAASSAAAAGGVLQGDDGELGVAERALAAWIRRVVSAPNTTTPEDVERLRAAGWTDAQVFAVTVFAALRLAFSTVNAGLGVGPDPEVRERAPEPVRAAVDYGRPVDASHAPSHAAARG